MTIKRYRSSDTARLLQQATKNVGRMKPNNNKPAPTERMQTNADSNGKFKNNYTVVGWDGDISARNETNTYDDCTRCAHSLLYAIVIV